MDRPSWPSLKRLRRPRADTVVRVAVVGVITLALVRAVFEDDPTDHGRFDREVGAITATGPGTLDIAVDGHTETAASVGVVIAPDAIDEAAEATRLWAIEAGGGLSLILADAPTRDEEGRLIAYLYPPGGGQTLGERLVASGLAFADRRYDHPYANTLEGHENVAIRERRGIWAGLPDREPRMPSWRLDWRDSQRLRFFNKTHGATTRPY